MLTQEERAQLGSSVERLKSQLNQLESEKGELLTDNRRMAEMLSTSEGDSREFTQVLERLTEERKSLQRQCLLLKDNGKSPELYCVCSQHVCIHTLFCYLN